MTTYEIRITWRKPKASTITIEATSQADALAKLAAKPGDYLRTLDPTEDSDRFDIREKKPEKKAPPRPDDDGKP